MRTKQGIETSSEEITEFLKRKLPELQRQCYRKQKLNVSWSLLPMQSSVSFSIKRLYERFSHIAKIVVFLEGKLCQKGLSEQKRKR